MRVWSHASHTEAWICLGQRLNLTWLKLRILRWIMDRQTCCNCAYKLVLLSTNGNQCRGVRGCLAICEAVLKNIKKYLRISSKCWCFLIVVMSRNELGDGIVDAGWFRMLWRHSNTVYGRNMSCACGELWRMWYWYVIGKNGTVGEGPGVGRV